MVDYKSTLLGFDSNQSDQFRVKTETSFPTDSPLLVSH